MASSSKNGEVCTRQISRNLAGADPIVSRAVVGRNVTHTDAELQCELER